MMYPVLRPSRCTRIRPLAPIGLRHSFTPAAVEALVFQHECQQCQWRIEPVAAFLEAPAFARLALVLTKAVYPLLPQSASGPQRAPLCPLHKLYRGGAGKANLVVAGLGRHHHAGRHGGARAEAKVCQAT